jgi:hypothetical protein
LKIILEVDKLAIVILYETTCSSHKTIEFVSIVLKNWDFFSLDIVGLSRGLVMGCNSKFHSISYSILSSTLVVDLKGKELGMELRLINLYGPYWDMKIF